MISVRIDSPLDFWVTYSGEITRIISAMSIYMKTLFDLGYEVNRIIVGGGVHELDTGYESFSKVYNSFEEMETHLCEDFEAEEDSLDGQMMTTLNFGLIIIEVERNNDKGRLQYSRGQIELSCGEDENTIEARCKPAIEPFIYRK